MSVPAIRLLFLTRWTAQWTLSMLLGALFLLTLMIPAASPAQDAERLLPDKGGVISKSPHFMQWSAHLHGGAFDLCVLTPAEVVAPLSSVLCYLRGEEPVPWVGEPGRGDSLDGSRILIIPARRADGLEAILAALGTALVLTVADTPGLAQRGVQIKLFTAGDSVRFEVNRDAVEVSGLEPCFRLVEMARIIDP